jgi:bacillopeptidase F
VIDPASPLMAGQSYDAELLPDGPGGIVDAAGNELEPDFQTFRALTDVSETAPGSAYKWRSLASSSAYGGSYTVNNTAGAAATWTFTGTSVTWYTITDPHQGIANVYIDGRTKPNVNNYSSTTKYKVARTFSGLSSGTHSITIRVSGAKGSSTGKDARVSIDAFKVGGLYGTPNVSYRWATVSSSGAQGGSYLAAKFPWTEMSFVFSGTSIDWRTTLGPGMGKATVYIDGVSKGTFDNYSGVTISKFNRPFAGLSDGVHTIKIMVSSAKNALSKDYTIAVDGFVVG